MPLLQCISPKLQLEEDLEIEEIDGRIAMLGAVRAARVCLSCHEGERGALLGDFSYELIQHAVDANGSADGDISSLGH